ncbi:MAG: hypothetical protein SGPRY_002398, partial [Prymnesium sp.]
VLLAHVRSTRVEVALKVVDKQKLRRYKKENEVRVESYILTSLCHPAIVSLLGAWSDQGALYLALTLLPGGELWSIAHKRGLPARLAAFYTAQLLSALGFLHAKQIVHRDVKPENVTAPQRPPPEGWVRLIDFGTAKLLRQEDVAAAGLVEVEDKRGRGGLFKEFVGTPEYMSPEAIDNKSTDTRAGEDLSLAYLWSLGCFVYMLLVGTPAFKGGSDYLTFKRTLARKFAFPEGMPSLAADLIDKLLVIEPSGRLGGDDEDHCATILKHPWFDGCPQAEIHKAPLPVPSLEELALQPGVDEVLRLAALSPHAPSSWSPSLRQRIVFELGKRGKLDQRVRDFFSLGPPPPPIEDDLEEFEKQASAEIDGDEPNTQSVEEGTLI